MNRERIMMATIGIACSLFTSDVSAQLFFGNRTRDIVIKSVMHPDDTSNSTAPRYGINRADVKRLNAIHGVKHAIPVRTIPRMWIQYGDRFIESELSGTTHEFLKSESSEIKSGRFLLEKDILNLNNVIVITTSDAKRLFGTEEAVGKNLHILEDYYLVVGVLDSPNQAAYIPNTTMRSRYGDLHISRNIGTFEATVFEVSEVRILLEKQSNRIEVFRLIIELLQRTHESVDYSISIERRK